jgi:signal transduction histidine kinase
MAGTDVKTHAAPGNEPSFPAPGIVLLAPDRTVIFATGRALQMLAVPSADASGVQTCAQRLGVALQSLPDAATATSRLPFEFTDASGRHRLLAEAHALPGGGWLLQLEDRDRLESMSLVLSDSVRAQMWKRLRPVLHHDFKAPIQSILWSLEILERTPPGKEGDDRKREALEVIRKETASLQGRLQSLLDEIAPYEAEPAVIDAAELLQRAAHLVRSECGLYGVETDVTIGEPGLRVEGHGDDLRLAVLSLLFLTLDYLREGGHLALVAARAGESIELVIEGRSVGRDTQAKRADVIGGAAYRVAAAIARDHGGRLAMADRSSICFIVTLPAHLPPAYPGESAGA